MRRFRILSWSLLMMTLRDRSTLFWGIAFPIGLTVLYGTITAQDQAGGVAAISWLATGVVALTIMASGLVGEAGHFTEMRERGTLQRVQATPLPPLQLVSAAMLVRLLVTLLQVVLVMAVAVVGFGAQTSAGGFAAGCVLALLGAAVFFAIGQAIGSVASTPRAAAAIGQALYFPLMFISNLFVPATQLPAWVAQVARFTPAYLLVDLLRPAFIPLIPTTQAAWLDALGLAVYAVVGLALFVRFFSWAPRG
ncbi:MAG: ABC transporter permease [Kouleothrix sp.]|nr:ABC transporter permease [Kouleothrix sp.]